MSTRRPGSATPTGARNSSALATEKIVVFAPIPMAIDSAAVKANSGLRRSSRVAKILQDRVRKRARADVPHAVFDGFDGRQRQGRGSTRVLRPHAAPDVFIDQQLE